MEFPTNFLAATEAWIAQATEEELAAMGLFPGDDATYAAEAAGSDAYSWESVVISSSACVDDAAEDAAATLMAASAAVLAVALLN